MPLDYDEDRGLYVARCGFGCRKSIKLSDPCMESPQNLAAFVDERAGEDWVFDDDGECYCRDTCHANAYGHPIPAIAGGRRRELNC